jgi:hypothetical protein
LSALPESPTVPEYDVLSPRTGATRRDCAVGRAVQGSPAVLEAVAQ